MRAIAKFIAGASLVALLGACGDNAQNEDNIRLSNGIQIPRNKISSITHFMDDEAGKEVTAYYFFQGIKSDEDAIYALVFEPPAIYDLGDGKPFKLMRDNPIPRMFRSYVNQAEVDWLIQQYSK